MFTTGSKLLIGSSVIAAISAIAYGVAQDGVMGTVGLASAAVALAFLAGINIYTNDSNIWDDEIASVETAPAAARPPANSIWPMAFALGAAVLTVGLVTYQAVFVVGVVLLLASGAEWTAEAWAERASADAAFNAEVRSRIANPLEFPLAAAIGIGIIVYSFSRIMLWLSKTNTVIAFAVLGVIILTVAFLAAYRPGLKSRAAVGAIAVGVLALVAGGAAAGLDGEREIKEHETTEGLTEEGEEICLSPEEFEADEKASQSVGAQANVAAEITLTEAGELDFDVVGPVESPDQLTLPRSNPNNVIFINESDHERRLSVDLTVPPAEAVEDEGPLLKCTTLVEPGGRQNITLTIGAPSFAAPDGYFFFVPGVESARLELVVP
ncbi:MAG TPA: hypothetical protein VMW33_07935 [Ilumatobacteraceae bacterium]|nr:hypothetical protein [Ilumatobacteraceae bacterium]